MAKTKNMKIREPGPYEEFVKYKEHAKLGANEDYDEYGESGAYEEFDKYEKF